MLLSAAIKPPIKRKSADRCEKSSEFVGARWAVAKMRRDSGMAQVGSIARRDRLGVDVQ
jgi:hypothetical protein